MAKITDKNQQLNRWLNRVFPPSAPEYTQPGEMKPELNLVLLALPPSLLYERSGIQSAFTVNPGTQLFFPSTLGRDSIGPTEPVAGSEQAIPFGKCLWVHYARWSPFTQVPTTAGRAWIATKLLANNVEFGVAAGFFSAVAGSFSTDFLDTRCPQAGNAGANWGGGGGQFIVPPGYVVHFSTAAAPAAATTFQAIIQYAYFDIGELHP